MLLCYQTVSFGGAVDSPMEKDAGTEIMEVPGERPAVS